jgi:uncharacterized RDD family membrane protein YckC
MGSVNKARDVTLGLLVTGARAGATAGRVVVFPARVAARTPLIGSVLRRTGGELEREGQDAQARARKRLETGAEETLDQVFAGPLPEAAVRSAAEHQLAQRIAAEIVARPEFEHAFAAALEHKATERLLTEAIDSRLAEELTDRIVQSPEFQRAVEQVAGSPGVRAALTRQSATLAEELVGGVRSRAESADDRLVLGKARRAEMAEPGAYGGIATRGIAFAVDLLLTLVLFLTGAGLANLAVALVGELRPQWLAATLLGGWWTIVSGTYFVVCWSAAGQTPGMRLMRLRVQRPDGRPPTAARSVVRLFGLLLAIIPFFAGFVPMLFDSRRRGLQDYLAGTTVVHAEREHLAVAPELGRAAPTLSS